MEQIKKLARILASALVLLFAVSETTLSQDWEQVGFPLKESITGLTTISKDTIHLVTSGGKHGRSYDGGKNWWGLQITDAIPLEDLFFLDNNRGITCGRKGAIHLTENAGQSWESISWPDTNATFISARLIDSTTILVAGFSNDKTALKPGLFLRSVSAGRNWEKISMPGRAIADITSSPSGKLFCLSFGFINSSLDDGANWRSRKYGIQQPGRLVVTSEKSAVMIGNYGMLAYSTDAAESWKPSLYEDKSQPNYITAVMLDDSVCYVGGTDGKLIRSSDGGKTWQRESLPVEFSIYDLDYIDGWLLAVGTDGVIIRKKLR